MEDSRQSFNDALKTVDQRSIKEVDDANAQINRRGQEIKEINDVMKNLLDKFSRMEARMHILEEEGLVREEMIASLQAEVDNLQTKICHCHETVPRPSSRNGSQDNPFTLEYVEENEYHPPPVVTALVPIKVEEERDPSRVLRFGDDKDEELVVEETVESSEDEEVPQENEVPLPVCLSSPPPAYAPSVCSGQCCKRSRGPLKSISYHPYCCADTFMGMPTGL